jgi:hypothetical protein
MSKTSSKSKYEQLMAWLPTLKKAKEERLRETTKFSKADYYKQQGVK